MGNGVEDIGCQNGLNLAKLRLLVIESWCHIRLVFVLLIDHDLFTVRTHQKSCKGILKLQIAFGLVTVKLGSSGLECFFINQASVFPFV